MCHKDINNKVYELNAIKKLNCHYGNLLGIYFMTIYIHISFKEFVLWEIYIYIVYILITKAQIMYINIEELYILFA